MYYIEVLDHNKDNWVEWKSKVTSLFRLYELGGYLDGSIPKPDPVVNPMSAFHWDKNNDKLLGLLQLKTSIVHHYYIENKTTVHDAWKSLVDRHEKLGTMAQIALLDKAFAIRYQPATVDLDTTTTSMLDVARKIYANGGFKFETFVSLIMLNAMSDQLPHVRDQVISSILNDPGYSHLDIRKRLNAEQQFIDLENYRAAAEAKKKSRNGKFCTNCKKPGHNIETCFLKRS
jgi:gag-polypeptide of LTR copia-type